MAKTYFVTWASNIEAESPEEAAIKAMAEIEDPDSWQFHSSVEELHDDDPFTSDEQEYCHDMCGNLTPCASYCNDFKNRFNKD